MNVPGFESDYTHGRRSFTIPPPRLWEYSPLLSLLFARQSVGNPYFPSKEFDLLRAVTHDYDGAVRYLKEAHPRSTADMLLAYERNVRTFLSLARGNGIEPVLSTEVIVDDCDVGYHFHHATARYNDLLRETARREKIGLIDFDAAMDWNPATFYDLTHLRDTPDGLGFKATYFAKRLIDMGLIERLYEARKRNAE